MTSLFGIHKTEVKEEPKTQIVSIVNPPVKFIKREGSDLVIENLNGDERALLIAGNGIFEYFKTGFGTVIRKLPKDRYPDISESMELSIAKLPEVMLKRALWFLREVYAKHSAEGAIVYFYNSEKKEYKEYVPKQEVAGASVEYNVPTEVYDAFRSEGFIVAGTIHSHPNFAAFQSGTDSKDEIAIDGWHITLGYITRPQPDYHCRWSFRGSIFDAKLEDIVEMGEEKIDYPAEWIESVSKKTYTVPVWKGSQVGHSRQLPHYSWKDDGWGADWENWNQPSMLSKKETAFIFQNESTVEETECIVIFD